MKKAIRKILIIIGGILFFMFSAPILGNILNIGNILGMAGSLCVIAIGIWLEPIIRLIKALCKSKLGKSIVAIVLALVITLGGAFSVALGSVIACSKTNATDEETIIILGCAVYGDVPSIMLNARVQQAYRYMMNNPQSVAVLSGGKGNMENISEAQCMYNILTKQGIAPERLFLEEQSTNTQQNIEFSTKIIEENGLSKNIAIATSDFHLKRATMYAKDYGIDAKRISASSGFFATPTFYVRDTLGVIEKYVFG